MIMKSIMLAMAIASATTVADASIIRYHCQMASGDDRMPLEFIYDDVTRKAQIVGNAGMAEVFPWIGEDGISFLELLPTGAVQSTTIDFRTGMAVHSRHTLLARLNKDAPLLPSQMRGTCTQR